MEGAGRRWYRTPLSNSPVHVRSDLIGRQAPSAAAAGIIVGIDAARALHAELRIPTFDGRTDAHAPFAAATDRGEHEGERGIKCPGRRRRTKVFSF